MLDMDNQKMQPSYLTHGALYHSSYDVRSKKNLSHSKSSHLQVADKAPQNLQSAVKYKSSSVGNLVAADKVAFLIILYKILSLGVSTQDGIKVKSV